MKRRMKLKKKKKKNMSCLARFSEVRRAMFSQKIHLNHLCTYVQERCFVSNSNNLSLPSSMSKSFLQKYEDVLEDEVPKGLLPIRGIEHKIDFIPGVVIPNRLAYKTNPTATKEI